MRKLRVFNKITFFEKFAYIKKKQYLCTRFQEDSGPWARYIFDTL